jgi:hypothetical protein
MVSVMCGSLADRYLNIAHKVVDCLEKKGHKVEYAFFYVRYDDDQHWTEGDWWLRLAVEGLEHNFEGVSIVNGILHALNVDTLDFNYNLDKPDWGTDCRFFDRIDIYRRVDIKE